MSNTTPASSALAFEQAFTETLSRINKALVLAEVKSLSCRNLCRVVLNRLRAYYDEEVKQNLADLQNFPMVCDFPSFDEFSEVRKILKRVTLTWCLRF
jgi:translation initiation factor 2B subunit (eIF-2B alpha/beta/delta family)